MSAKRGAVVTGIGLVSSAGHSLAALKQAFADGRPHVGEVRLFDSSPFGARTAAGAEFDPSEFLGKKGLRSLDRGTKLALVASHLAARDAQMEPKVPGSRVGVAVGATYGSLAVYGEFDREILSSGPSWVNPAMFPYTVQNAQAGSIAIRQDATAANLTFASGPVSSFDAMNAAVALIESGQADVMYTGGLEPLSFDLFAHLSMLELLGKDGVGDERTPYSRRSSGVMVGEGACILILESAERAQARDAPVLARIEAGETVLADDMSRNALAESLHATCTQTMSKAGIRAADLGWICGSGSGWRIGDSAELDGVRRVLGDGWRDVPISTAKLALGETASAAGAFQAAAAIASFNQGSIPLLPAHLDFISDLRICTKVTQNTGKNVLCTAVGWNGQCSSFLMTAP